MIIRNHQYKIVTLKTFRIILQKKTNLLQNSRLYKVCFLDFLH